MVLFSLAACGPDIPAEYRAAKVEALTKANALTASEGYDVALTLSRGDLEALLGEAIGEQVRGDPLSSSPAFRVASVHLAKAPKERFTCIDSDCGVDLDLSLGLTSAQKSGIAADVELRVGWADQEHTLVARVGTVEAEDLGLRTLIAKVPPVELAKIGGEALPVVRHHIHAEASGAITLLARTNVVDTTPLAALPDLPAGVRLAVSMSALSGLLRRAAFEHGALADGTAIEPSRFEVDGDRFTMRLRVWNLDGRGWRRDYAAAGTLGVDRRAIRIVPTSVTEVGTRPGATLADPVMAPSAALLASVEERLARSIPTRHDGKGDGFGVGAWIDRAYGADGALVVEGDLQGLR